MTRVAFPLVLAAALLMVAGDASADIIRDRLSLGLHAGGGGLGDDNDEAAEPLSVGTAGLTVRYGISRRWDVELAGEGIVGEDEALRRSISLVTLSARFRINPEARWRWSVFAGLGSAEEQTEVLDADGESIFTREFQHGAVVLGGTFERRFRRFGISAELRAIGLVRNDDELDGPEFAGKSTLIPTNSSGGDLRLAATYYF